MNRNWMLAIALLLPAAPTWSQTSYLRCEVQTTFRKPSLHGTEWVHAENHYVKYFRLDSTQHMVSVYDWRPDVYKPICSDSNAACVRRWSSDEISIDARAGSDDPVPPFLDFRRAIQLSDHLHRVSFVIADYGIAASGVTPMSWTYEGTCQPSAQPVRPVPPDAAGGAGAARQPANPSYEKPSGPALSVDAAEAAQALAGYYGNTMWGFSGGGHWFHMWFLDGNLAYTSDDEDISSEGKPRRWNVGKDSTGYRLCSELIPPEGKMGCYPLPQHRVGDSWVQHDMDGDALFSLLPGRQ